MTPLRNEAGFTLVEMLVALTIFALLAAAGVGLLRTSVDTQAAVEGRLVTLAGIGRAHAMFASDLGQLLDRPTRSGGGERPAFLGDPARMEFVRGGWSNLDGSPRSDLQRVVWQAGNGALLRAGHAALDGEGKEEAAVIVRADQVRFRYRAVGGAWSSQFRPAAAQSLPVAVEMTLTTDGKAPVVLVVTTPAASGVAI